MMPENRIHITFADQSASIQDFAVGEAGVVVQPHDSAYCRHTLMRFPGCLVDLQTGECWADGLFPNVAVRKLKSGDKIKLEVG
jgi:hypothetical protein